MSNRINELANEKRREEQDSLAIKLTNETERRRRIYLNNVSEAAIRAAVSALASKFYGWAKRNRLPTGFAGQDHVSYPPGWIIGYYSNIGGEDYQSYSNNYALLITPSGKLKTLVMSNGRRGRYRKKSGIDLAKFNVENMEHTIAGIVSRSEVSWN